MGSLQQYMLNRFNKPGVYGGAIIICNHMTKQGFFQKKLFGLPGYATTFIKKIRAGMLLFVFECEERKLYGVFEATSDGALNILPDAFTSLRKPRPAQTREASIGEGKQDVGCLVQKTRSKGEDVSAKIKLMSHSCSSNSRSLVTQTGIKLTYTVLTDKE
ncbi:hypothetical protein E2562_003606 [Oryza meyeriana var. granulata]|uniref:DCD domain-containing protein n=1 Tax=Oryza meyeriana var. granulata TaxID=110450 RepID=A0A6G1CLY0_9ORYZ|nr:hypothetical protein E2562_003606 [Oryza meyeriana var. granulata]